MRLRPTFYLLCGALLLDLVAAASGHAAPAGQAPAAETLPALPDTIPLFPLPDTALFPHLAVPLHVYEPRYRAMIADALKGDRVIGIVQLRPGYEADYEKSPSVFPVGCAGVITDVVEKPNGEYDIVLRGLVKFRLIREERLTPYRLARVTPLPEPLGTEARAGLHERRLRLDGLLAQAVDRLGFAPVPAGVPDEELVDGLAQFLEMDTLDRQKLLELDGPAARAGVLAGMLEAMLK